VTDAVAAKLLNALRERLGQPDLEYAEPLERLTGGYYTDNRAFRVAAEDPLWAVPLVLRLFPREGAPDQARREAAVQAALVEQGFAAPSVRWCEPREEVLGRQFFIMEKLPGRSPMGGVEPSSFIRSIPWVLRHMTNELAEIQSALHALDPDPLVAALGDLPAGVERWLAALDDHAANAAPELRAAAQWLREHQPTPPRVAICHGDLWGGNLLYDGRRLTGVIDWSLATVADPALDVGFTAMALTIAPVNGGPTLQRIVTRISRTISRRYVNAYVARTGADLSDQPYYEALRCALELVDVITHRRALAEDRERDAPAPTWDRASDRMVEYFEVRTGVRLEIPPKVI